MPLDPEIDAFLELVAANAPSRPLHERPLDEIRAAYEATSRILDRADPSWAVDASPLRLQFADGAIDARLYAPAAGRASEGWPVLLYFHGGGYTLGSLDSHDPLCRSLASYAQCAVVSAAYRLAPEHAFPAAFCDAVDAYRWLLDHGARHNLDTRRIAVGGDSVGGTLATALTIAVRDACWIRPVAQVLLYPCTSARQDSRSHREFARGYLLEASTLQWMFANYLRSDTDRTDWRFAPLEAPDLTDLPPAFIALAEYDPLIDEGTAYAHRLEASGVRTRLSVYSGMIHDFARLGNIVADADRLRREIAQALAAAFR